MGKAEFGKYIALMRNPKINKTALVSAILSDCTFEELKSFRKKVPGLFQGMLKMPYLRKKRFENVFVKGFSLKRDAKDIFGALTFVILNNADVLNNYLTLKTQLDIATATGHYEEASALLDRIEKEVSASMFTTHYKLKLIRLEKGATEATNFYNDICKNNNPLSYFSNVIFKTSQIGLPLEPEVEKLNRVIPQNNEYGDLIKGFVMPYMSTGTDTWLVYLMAFSLIDLYECFVNHLSLLSREKLKDSHLGMLVGELASNLSDRRLQRLNSLINFQKASDYSEIYERERDLIENYYAGYYEYVIENAREYLKTNPLEVAIIDIYFKACIKTHHIPEDLFPEGTVAEKLHSLYHYGLYDGTIGETMRILLRSLGIAWYQIPHMRQVYHSFKDLERNIDTSIYKDYWRHSMTPEIRDALFFDTKEEATDYLTTSGYSGEGGASIGILEGELNDYHNQTRRLLYGFDDNEINAFLEEIESKSPTPTLLSIIVSQLFSRLMKLGRIQEAISMYVRFRLKNRDLRIRVDKSQINSVMTDMVDADVPDQMELSIFYTMIGGAIYKRYLAYKRCLRSLGIHRASEIKDIGTPALRYFLGKVADRDVLNLHVLQFDTDEDVVNERIDLCKRLFESTSRKVYAEEITSLIKEQEVKTLSQQVSDSKIHVDVQSLIKGGLEMERNIFKSYLDIDDNVEFLDQNDFEEVLDFLKNQNQENVVASTSGQPSEKYRKVLFRKIVLSIRDKFLFDPVFGLDKYLSARIRHGTLLTQLRNHFLAHSLVTNKKEGGDYERKSKWTRGKDAHFTETEMEAINDRMYLFTVWLDGQLKSIKDELIQIKTETNDVASRGLFDYTDTLMYERIDALEQNKFDSFETFIIPAVDLLWEWTGSVLGRVRNFFADYEKIVIAEVTELQKDITKLMHNSPALSRRFKDEITTCLTEFQNDITEVSGWFKPEQSNVRSFTIRQAVDTSLAVINKINQNALSFNKISIEDTATYDGKYFNAIHDIFHDMMNNILAYEKKRPQFKGMAEIKISETDSRLSIEVSNPLEKSDIPNLQRIIDGQSNLPDLIASGKTRRENNSGCVKIFSTVMYALGSANRYANVIENDRFTAKIEINPKTLLYDEDTDS